MLTRNMVGHHVDEIDMYGRVGKGSLFDSSGHLMRGVHGEVAEVDGDDSSVLGEGSLDQVYLYFEEGRLGSDEKLNTFVEDKLSVDEDFAFAVG